MYMYKYVTCMYVCLSIVINCVRLLTRLIPFLFESDDWRLLFWTPAQFTEVTPSSNLNL